MIRLATPFLVALTPRSVEVHDLALLTPVQAVQIGPADSRWLCTGVSNGSSSGLDGGRGGSGYGQAGAAVDIASASSYVDHLYLSSAESISLLKMQPIEMQVELLVEGKQVRGNGAPSPSSLPLSRIQTLAYGNAFWTHLTPLYHHPQFEEALAICSLCGAQARKGGIDVPTIHEQFGKLLHVR